MIPNFDPSLRERDRDGWGNPPPENAAAPRPFSPFGMFDGSLRERDRDGWGAPAQEELADPAEFSPRREKDDTARETFPGYTFKDGVYVPDQPAPQATNDRIKPPTETPTGDAPEPLPTDTPLSDTDAGLLSPLVAMAQAAGGAINEAFEPTDGDELTAAPVGQLLRSIPLVGTLELGTEMASPEAQEFLTKTPLRDTPILGPVVRGAEAALGVLGAGQAISRPLGGLLALGQTALEEEYSKIPYGDTVLKAFQKQNPIVNLLVQEGRTQTPEIFEQVHSTPDEVGALIGGFLTGANTPEQNEKLELISRQAGEYNLRVNPIQGAVAESPFDPLTWLDGGGILPQIGRMQQFRRALEATADVADVGAAISKANINPIEKIILGILKPRNLDEGAEVTEKALGLPAKGEQNLVRRALTPFSFTPEAKVKYVVQRVSDNVLGAWADSGRPFADKLKQVELMNHAAKNPELMDDALRDFMGERGIVDTLDNRRAVKAALDFTPRESVKQYDKAKELLESLRQGQDAGTVLDEAQAGIVRASAEEIDPTYFTIFDRVITDWKTGKLDLNQAEQAIERLAGYRLGMEFTEHAGRTLAKLAGLKQPNFITRLLETIKAYEGLIFVGGNPAAIATNTLNSVGTLARFGVTPEDTTAFFKRIGYTPDADTGKRVSEAVRGIGNADIPNAPLGASVPKWLRDAPGLKQLSAGWQWSEGKARELALITGYERFMSNNFKYGREIPLLPQPVIDYVRATKGEQGIRRLIAELENARNMDEARAAMLGKSTWASYRDEIAKNLSVQLSDLAGRPVNITGQMLNDALPLKTRESFRRIFLDMWEQIDNGTDPATAYRNAVANEGANNLFPTSPTSASPTPNTAPTNTPIDPLERFWNKVPKSDLNRMGKEVQTFQRNYGRAPTVAELEDMLAGRNPAPEIPLTEPKPAQAPQPRQAPQLSETGAPVNNAQGIIESGSSTAPAPSAFSNPVIADLQARAANITEPNIPKGMLREWNALRHEGEAENVQRATQRAVNNMSPDVWVEKARQWVEEGRANGETWMLTFADMLEDRAHYVIDQIAAGNPKYNTPEYLDRVANGDALVRLLRGGENGFDWTKLDAPYEYRPYESFAEYRRRVTDEFIDRELIGAGDVVSPRETSVSTASAGPGNAAGIGDALGNADIADNVAPTPEVETVAPVPQSGAEQLRQVFEDAKAQGPGAAVDLKITQGWDDAIAKAALDAMERAIADDALRGAGIMPEGVLNAANDYLNTRYAPAQTTAKLGANAAGRYMQEATVLNYDRRYNIDDAALLLQPFTYWWLHSLLNYTKDFIDHPAMLAFYVKLREELDKASEGMPDRYKHRVEMAMPLGDLGAGIWIDPVKPFAPVDEIYRLSALERAGYQGVNEDGTVDYNSAFADLFGLHLPIKFAWALATGQPDEIQHIVASLPAARLLRGLTANLTPGGIGLDSKWDKFYYERALKELVAEGVLTHEQAQVALLQQKGKDWDAVRERAGLENYTVRELSGALGLRGYAFTPGEQKYLSARKDRDNLLTESVRRLGGNPNMPPDEQYAFLSQRDFYSSPEWLQFKEQHPELDTASFVNQAYGESGVRIPEDEAQEERYRAYLFDQVGEIYYGASALQKKIWGIELGEDFQKLFRNKDTRNYDAVPMRTLLGWANALEANLLKVANYEAPPPDASRVTFPEEAQNKAYQAYYDDVETTLGWDKYHELNSHYFNLRDTNKTEANKWLKTPEGKKLAAVWSAEKELYKEYPEIKKLLEDVGAEKKSTPSDPKQAAREAVMAAYGYDYDTYHAENEAYWALPAGEARTAYLAAHPNLQRMFTLNRILDDKSENSGKGGSSTSTKPKKQYNEADYVRPVKQRNRSYGQNQRPEQLKSVEYWMKYQQGNRNWQARNQPRPELPPLPGQ